MSTLRVALSGAGYIAPLHIAGWRRAGAEVVAIADPDGDRAHFTADNHEIAGVYDDVDRMLEAVEADVLDVASPRQVHTAQSRTGLSRGLAVMCQKPLAPSLADALAFADTLAPGDRFMVHENWRFRPPYRAVRSWIDAGLIGPIRHVDLKVRTSAMMPDAGGIRPVARRQPFMLSEPRLLVAEVLIHHIDTLRYLVGELILREAFGMAADPDIVGETAATLDFLGPEGIPVRLSGDMTAHGAPPGATDSLEILGSRGRAVLEGERLTLYGAVQQELDFSGRDLLAEGANATIAHFVEGMRTGAAFETGLADNLATLTLVEEAYRMMGDIRRAPR